MTIHFTLEGRNLKKSIFLIVFTALLSNLYSASWTPRVPTDEIRFSTSHEVTLAYKYYGRNDAKKTILFIYGFDGSIMMTDTFAPYLALDYNVLVFDFPGHGYSAVYDDMSREVLKNAVFALLDELDEDEVILAGYSIGGPFALDLYTSKPGLFSHLILLMTSANFEKNRFRKQYFRILTYWLEKDFTGTMHNFALPLLKDVHMSRALMDLAMDITVSNDMPSVLHMFKSFLAYNCEPLLQKIDCPVLILGSAFDPLAPAGDSFFLKKHIKNARLKIFFHLGHLAPVTGAEFIHAEIVRFLE